MLAALLKLLTPDLSHALVAALAAALAWWAKQSVPPDLKPVVGVLKARHAARKSAKQDGEAQAVLDELARK